MTSIRAQIDAHSPIIARTSKEGTVLVERADLTELFELAGRAVPWSPQGADAAVGIEEFQLLVQDAHEKIHGHPSVSDRPRSSDPAADRLLGAIFGDDEPTHEDNVRAHQAFLDQTPVDVYADDSDSQTDDSDSQTDDSDSQTDEDAQYRSAAMHYAVQLVSVQIQSAHGLGAPGPESVVGVAESILSFLRG